MSKASKLLNKLNELNESDKFKYVTSSLSTPSGGGNGTKEKVHNSLSDAKNYADIFKQKGRLSVHVVHAEPDSNGFHKSIEVHQRDPYGNGEWKIRKANPDEGKKII